MSMNKAQLNTIIGLYDEAFYGMDPFIGAISPTLRSKIFFK